MNAGARALALVPASLSEIAGKVSPPTTRQAVSLWRRGRTLPSQTHRTALEALYGIPRGAWDPLPIATSDAPGEAAAGAETVAYGSALDELRGEVRRYERRLAALESDPGASLRQFALLLSGKVSALARVARLELEEHVVRAEAEKVVLDRLRPVLERHPDVAAEIAAALGAP